MSFPKAQRHKGTEALRRVAPLPPRRFKKRFLFSRSRSLTALLCAFVPLCLSAFAESATDLYAKANRAFASGHYADAVRDYETIATREGVSAPLLFNLANTYFRDGKTGRAILCYERALWLAPHDADIEANLRLVRKASGLFAPDLNGWEQVAHLLSINQWAWFASLTLTWLCMILAVRRIFRNAPWMVGLNRNPRRIAIVLLAIGLVQSLGAIGTYAREMNRAVVVTTDVTLRISPYDAAQSSGSLLTGELVRIENTHENYCYVRTPQGRVGWVSNQQVERIVR